MSQAVLCLLITHMDASNQDSRHPRSLCDTTWRGGGEWRPASPPGDWPGGWPALAPSEEGGGASLASVGSGSPRVRWERSHLTVSVWPACSFPGPLAGKAGFPGGFWPLPPHPPERPPVQDVGSRQEPGNALPCPETLAGTAVSPPLGPVLCVMLRSLS